MHDYFDMRLIYVKIKHNYVNMWDRYVNMKLKIARPDSLQNFMDTVKTIDLTHLCIQINNTVVFSNHAHIKFIEKFKTKNMSTTIRKYWVTPDYGHSS